MADSKASEKGTASSWIKGLKAEYKKVIWPDRIALAKQTTAVVVSSVILGVIITLVDVLVRNGIQLLIK